VQCSLLHISQRATADRMIEKVTCARPDQAGAIAGLIGFDIRRP
jgi:hypothetical protein